VAITDTEIVERILLFEGSKYTDDPDDAGGPTRWGITQAVLAEWRGTITTPQDVQLLTREEAAAIYAHRYIRPFDGLPDPLRLNVVDMGVNAGVPRATILLQQTVGATVDGKLGPETKRLAAVTSWSPLFTGVRIAFYEDLIRAKPSQMKYRRGWRRRALSFVMPQVLSQVPRATLRTPGEPIFGHMGKAA